MELKKGYKQTEVGVIPEEWSVKAIEEFASVKSGKRLPLGNYLTDKVTPHPYIRVADMFPGGVNLSDIRYVPENIFPSIKNYRIFKEDIFISVAGTLGIVGKIPEELDGANLTENADRLTDIGCERDYLLYVLMSSLIQKTIESEMTLGAQPKLALTRIRKFFIPLPPTKAEQTAIGTALSDADALIQSLEKLIAKKRLIKQGAMQELLKPKEGWVVKKLGEIFSITAGGDLRKDAFSSVNDEKYCYPIYSNSLTNAGLYGYCSSYDHDGNCITVTARGTVGFSNSRDHKFSAIGRLLILKPIEKLNCVFIAEYINLKVEFANESTGVPQLTAPQISNYEVVIPDYTEQTRIATILADMDAEISALETKLAKYKQIKQGMMQNLLTGKIRLV
jgi:type I restriction enzyme S subunit